MRGNSNWKTEDSGNSNFNYINPRIPLKSRYVRANQILYMDKTVSKAMVRSRLKNKYRKNMSVENKRNYTKKILCQTFEKRKGKLFC